MVIKTLYVENLRSLFQSRCGETGAAVSHSQGPSLLVGLPAEQLQHRHNLCSHLAFEIRRTVDQGQEWGLWGLAQ